MTTPIIRLATDDDMRAIDSRNLDDIGRLPALYIALRHLLPGETDPDAMKHWGVAHEHSLADFARLYPEALVASHDFGDRASREDLVYHGAEPAKAFIPQPCASQRRDRQHCGDERSSCPCLQDQGSARQQRSAGR